MERAQTTADTARLPHPHPVYSSQPVQARLGHAEFTGKIHSDARASIEALLNQYGKYRARYLASDYLESQARLDFIDKFWTALGWDVRHTHQQNPYTQEVRIEVSKESESGRKRPDYTFYLAPEFREPRFLVEAKRPGVDLTSIDPLLQAVKYGWNAGLPIVILHNFAQLCVIDTRFPADPTTVDQRIVAKFDADALHDEATFDKLYYLLSREAVSRGSIVAFVEALPSSRRRQSQHFLFRGGYRPIDLAFLNTLEEWREQLAHALKKRNPWMDGPALTEVNQRILDRLVMLRFLEDKGIECRIGLEALARPGESWARFQRASRQLDSTYNGIVFKHHTLIDGIRMRTDDSVFLNICDELNPRTSPYDFVQIPVQLLGSIYERFLSKVIVTTPTRARIEKRPEVRKAGGVYYTPTHIVNYIVDATLNPLVKGKSFKELKQLRFVDPACGSGSFLIAAFEKLIVAAAGWFNLDPKRARKYGCVPLAQGGWRLSLSQKRELLVSCIYGIDLDHQAIEVAQLSLSLKLLEEETAASTLGQQEFQQTLLPSLMYNVVVGNSLVDHDFYDDDMFPDAALQVKPTKLRTTFAKVFEEGGFDAVIGNPPYLFITKLSREEKQYFQRRYRTAQYRFDVYALFIERAVTELLKPHGRLGFIVPHTLLANDSFEKIRRLLLADGFVSQALDIGPGAFQDAKNETMIVVYERAPSKSRKTQACMTTAATFPTFHKAFTIDQKVWLKNPRAAWRLNVADEERRIIEVMDRAGKKLGDLCTVNQGLRTGNNRKLLSDRRGSEALWKRVAGGSEVHRYKAIDEKLWVLYDPARLDAPRKPELFDTPEKLVVQEIRNISLDRRIVATLDQRRTYCLQSTNVINRRQGTDCDLRYLLAVLNSSVMNQYFRLCFPSNNHIASNQLATLPIPDSTELEKRRLCKLVDAIMSTTESLATTAAEHVRTSLESKRNALDAQIDRLVRQLYGFSEENEANRVDVAAAEVAQPAPGKSRSLARRKLDRRLTIRASI